MCSNQLLSAFQMCVDFIWDGAYQEALGMNSIRRVIPQPKENITGCWFPNFCFTLLALFCPKGAQFVLFSYDQKSSWLQFTKYPRSAFACEISKWLLWVVGACVQCTVFSWRFSQSGTQVLERERGKNIIWASRQIGSHNHSVYSLVETLDKWSVYEFLDILYPVK